MGPPLSTRWLNTIVLVSAMLLALTGCGSRWRVLVRFTIPSCEADRPSPSACPVARSDVFTVVGTSWRVTGERDAMRFVGAWTADARTPLRESRTELRDATRSHYFDAPGQFLIFNSSAQAVRVVIEEYR